ncbi:MAG: hypothetical protein HY072_02960 [Deltaproteobacteria bacterium]|nr:hypothetical protein [Deltaproteobacteria bacterium]
MKTLLFFLFAITLAMPVAITVFAEDAPNHEMGAPGPNTNAPGKPPVADKMHERNMEHKRQHEAEMKKQEDMKQHDEEMKKHEDMKQNDEEMKKKHAKHQEMMKKMMENKKHDMKGNMPDQMQDKMPKHQDHKDK